MSRQLQKNYMSSTLEVECLYIFLFTWCSCRSRVGNALGTRRTSSSGAGQRVLIIEGPRRTLHVVSCTHGAADIPGAGAAPLFRSNIRRVTLVNAYSRRDAFNWRHC